MILLGGLALLFSSSLVTATRFCQCENPSHDRIFPGINNVCNGMGEDWCSTNCNSVGYNCDYCQFKPAGYGTDADFAKLKSWCSQQSGYDSGKQISYRGTDVFCYSAKNARGDYGFVEGGCRHEDNGDDPLPPDKIRDATVKFRYPFNGEYVKRVCNKLLRRDGPLLVDGFLKRNNPECKWLKNETTFHQIECPYVDGRANRNKFLADFKYDCEYYGGNWYAEWNGPPDVAVTDLAQLTLDAGNQRILNRPHKVAVDIVERLGLKAISNGPDSEDNEGDSRSDTSSEDPPDDAAPPHGPGDVDGPDDPDKHHKDQSVRKLGTSSNSEESRVVYEHDGVKITFVD